MWTLLARSYYKAEDEEDAVPDVDWRLTDDEQVVVGELEGDEDNFGEYTVEVLGPLTDSDKRPRLQIIESIRSSVVNPKENLYVFNDELAEILKKEGVSFKRVGSELDLP